MPLTLEGTPAKNKGRIQPQGARRVEGLQLFYVTVSLAKSFQDHVHPFR